MKNNLIRIDLVINTFDLLNNGIDPLKTHEVFEILLKEVNQGSLKNNKKDLIDKVLEINKSKKFGDIDFNYMKPNFK